MVLARFLPQDERFFDYFHKAVENAAAVAEALRDLLDNYSDVERKARRVRDLENRGDEITHQIFDALNLPYKVWKPIGNSGLCTSPPSPICRSLLKI
jgi:uncharacterized protein Yka (UPF0111/DUF47 family)